MLNLITPVIFEPCNRITSFFTESNRGEYNQHLQISGLNLGLNTDEDSSVIKKNYQFVQQKTGCSPNPFALAHQVHSSIVKVIDKPGIYKHTDGLITRKPSLILGIQIADCATVLIADIKNQVIGAFHAGWRGASEGIVSKGLAVMKELGSRSPHFKAYISPCISQANFEVGPEVAEKFPDQFCDYISYRKPHIDLKGFLKYELESAGVQSIDIEVSSFCTVDSSRFYSYRRERNHAGRMLGCIMLKSS